MRGTRPDKRRLLYFVLGGDDNNDNHHDNNDDDGGDDDDDDDDHKRYDLQSSWLFVFPTVRELDLLCERHIIICDLIRTFEEMKLLCAGFLKAEERRKWGRRRL